MKTTKKIAVGALLCCLITTMIPTSIWALEKNGTVDVNSWLNVRTAPNTNSEIVKKLQNGDKVTIVEEQVIGNSRWGRCSDGWVSLNYINYNDAVASAKTGTGYVRVRNWLNVRETPGMDGKIVDKFYNSTKVEITETKQVNGQNWGKTSKGWVALAYIDFGSMGTHHIKTFGSKLNVRTGPGTQFESVNGLDNGTEINILELNANKTWGRIGTNQWVCMHYVSD